ncbi:flagellar basal body rod protein FlgB [Magnetospira sp. QH-2]|uniref:flagellar basal body rod protein FlgB n=1 Tax=Magnetospira sp. (strain QH-2) TaxID=1288970 RepID=UPI0003E80F5D|nr:flagellar basal body rod protein FlgB [Magnetospira sp. QH-2]CCQ74109.1 putative Flagellar basal-body rod protein FlgB [Magnetospira sp. QH-2]
MADVTLGLNGITTFKALKERMKWAASRQSLLSQNIANADTPEYRPKDLKPMEFEDMVRNKLQITPVQQTNSNHMQGTLGSSRYRAEEQQPYETSPDGNQVLLEEQMMKMGQNQFTQKMSSQLYRKHLMMIKTAAGKGG